MQENYTGLERSVYREGDLLIAIISRAPIAERQRPSDALTIPINVGDGSARLAEVVGEPSLTWRDARLRRTERALTITAQADPAIGVLADDLFQRLKPKIEAIPLPAGFSLSWEGEFGSSEEAQGSLTKTLPLALLSMVLVVVLLFNGFRQPIVVWSVVPLAIVGVVIGLVLTGLPLEFMGILGLLSLSGLIIQNALVLVYTADQLMASGASTNEALIEASASRLRPVMMGSFTTVFGILPLYFDAFFQSMTIVIAFGLTFATLITLVVVPALYALLLGPRRQGAVDITATQHAC